jgi:2',3'-cyclic-nucleotide 2'-phosphodiesterase (5'-nucleotidase family)
MYRYLFIFSLMAGCGPSAPVGDDMGMGADLATGPRRLVLLHTNDEHSHLFAFAPELDDFQKASTGTLKGGVARRATVLKAERDAAAKAGAATLTLSAGDNTMGTLPEVGFTTSAPDFTLMKQLGYDATCLGNHEMDFGPKALATALAAAKSKSALIPTLSTNIHFDGASPDDDTLAAAYADTPDPSKLVQKFYVLTTSNGIKVGLVGIMGASAAYYAPFKKPVTFSLGASKDETNTAEILPVIYADIQPTVDRLRNVEKVDLVVALSHAGVSLSNPSDGDDYNIAQNVAGIDVIVSGHTHTVVTAPIVVENKTSKKKVLIVQAGSFGAWVGKLDLTLATDGTVSFDAASSKLLPVDETVKPDDAFVAAQAAAVKGIEGDVVKNGKSFLELALTNIEGAPATDDKMKDGDLYFRSLGATGFDVIGEKASQETAMLNLSSDAMFAAGKKYLPNELPDLAVQSSGVLRGDLPKGKTGVLAFADAFRILPLGFSPVDGSVGYPLAHAYLYLVEIKAAFEIAASLGLAEATNSLYFAPSGLRVTYDTTRPAFDTKGNPLDPANGRVTKLEWSSTRDPEMIDTVLYDIARAGAEWDSKAGGALQSYHVVTNLYIASFAASVGVTLKDKNGAPVKLADTILHRPDQSEVKDFEAFAAQIRNECMGNAGMLPARYDTSKAEGMVPRRMICSGPQCGR